jgi:asparagine synthase (glutamine-hydrolysing)
VRDHIGICPLYIGWGADGSVWFASEFKALVDTCTRFEPFPPGHVYDRCGERHPANPHRAAHWPQAQN